MTYPDVVKLVKVSTDGYGDKTASEITDVQASLIRRSSVVHTDNMDSETSDASVYLSPTNLKVLEYKYDLEGMYIISADNDWFRITSVNLAERKLLDNTLENVYCRLERIAGLPYDIS